MRFEICLWPDFMISWCHWFCATLCHSTPSMEKKQSQVQMKKLSNGSWAIERGFSQLHLTWMQVMASASTYLQLFFLLATLLQHIDDTLKWWTHFTFGAKLCKDNNYKNTGSPHFYVMWTWSKYNEPTRLILGQFENVSSFFFFNSKDKVWYI